MSAEPTQATNAALNPQRWRQCKAERDDLDPSRSLFDEVENRMSPTAPLRPCAAPGCPTLVARGRCPAHARQAEQRRGSAASRGYDRSWQRFRQHFINRLIVFGIVPACGARLPDGPDTAAWSRCAQQGLINGDNLHVDHEPPSTEDERARAKAGDRRALDDVRRVGLLCATCHRAKTLTQWVNRTVAGPSSI